MVVPAKATGIDNYDFIDLLDYTTVGTYNNFIWTVAGDNMVSIDMPSSGLVQYIDLLVESETSDFEVYYQKPNGSEQLLTKSSIGNGLYRVYGTVSKWRVESVDLRLAYGVAGWINFLRADISMVSTSHFFTPCSGLFEAMEFYEYLYRDPSTSDPAYIEDVFDGELEADTAFTLTMEVPLWRNFDYIDIELALLTEEITSISAYYGDIVLPVDVSEYSGAADDRSQRIVTMRVDMRGLNKQLEDKYGNPLEPVFYVSGNLSPLKTFKVHILNCSGYVITNDVNPLYYYFRDLGNRISGFFSDLGDSFASQFDGLKSHLSGLVQSVIDAIYDANSDDPSGDVTVPTETEATEDPVATQESVMEDLVDQMDDVTKPSIDDVEADISDIADADSLVLATSGLGVLMENSILAPVFTLCLIFSVASYVLFGKR